MFFYTCVVLTSSVLLLGRIFTSTELLKYLIITAICCYTAVNYIILYGAQTSVCVTNYVHIYRRTTLMFIPRQSTVIGFWKCCFVLIHSQVCWVRFFECAANSVGGERLRREGETSRSRGETGDIILLNESLRFIHNVASCYALCLTKESVNTATLVHAPACVCVFVCACVRACFYIPVGDLNLNTHRLMGTILEPKLRSSWVNKLINHTELSFLKI